MKFFGGIIKKSCDIYGAGIVVIVVIFKCTLLRINICYMIIFLATKIHTFENLTKN